MCEAEGSNSLVGMREKQQRDAGKGCNSLLGGVAELGVIGSAIVEDILHKWFIPQACNGGGNFRRQVVVSTGLPLDPQNLIRLCLSSSK